jgi:hypothetical protein
MSLSSPITSFTPWQIESLARSRKIGAVIVEPAPLAFAETPQFVFTHIPKTAGLTLRAALATVCAFNGWSWEEILGSPQQAVGAYRARPVDRLRAARFVWGHLPYGAHDPRVPHVTLIRDPVPLILSSYAMGVARGSFALGTPLEELFELNHCLDNPQTRLLSGLQDKLVPGSTCDQATFDLALANLRSRYAVVAELARFDDFLAVMLAALRAPPLMYFRRNIHAVDLPEDLAASFKAEAERRTMFDAALFKAVEGKVRVGLKTSAAATPGRSERCLAFRNEEGRKFVHDPDGPDSLMAKVKAQGIAVKRHGFNPAALYVREDAARA